MTSPSLCSLEGEVPFELEFIGSKCVPFDFFFFLPMYSLSFSDNYFSICLQDREIMRVLVECCLQEKVFNKYYTALASRLCKYDKNYKFTLQVFLSLHFWIKMFLEYNFEVGMTKYFGLILGK